MARRTVIRFLVAMLLTTYAASSGALAQSPQYAPLDHPGPELSVPETELVASLDCTGDLSGGQPATLLIHGTNLDYETNFSWNYQREFAALGWPHCGVTLPLMGMDDIQVSAEYVVHAIRTMATASGGPIRIVGFSQGGMIGRWALRWWPDTRPLVSELVGLAPSNHGTLTAIPTCNPSCVPAYQQQRADSRFIAALNSRAQVFPGIDYTVVYTRTDWVVTPNHDGSASSLPGAANIAIQEVCPTATSEHLQLGSYDAVGYALVHDALTHDGPADPARLGLAVCAQPFMPGVNPASFPADWARYMRAVADAYEQTEPVTQEPPLACYVTASCAGDAEQSQPPAASTPVLGATVGLAALGARASRKN